MKVTRRDLLGWSAGAAAGLLFTPVPWKLLDDTSIWTQNWRWIPQPTRGPVEVKQSFCTLCPNGCGVRVRMAAGWPVGVAGVASDPISRGALCPLGFAAQQLNWHPQRVHTVRHRGNSTSWEEARVAFAKACGEGKIAIVDGQPGRAASVAMKTFVEKRDGSYRVALAPEAQALAPYGAWSGLGAIGLGYDLENAQTVVSFGAPLLDGWGAPGRFTRLWAERAAGMADPQLRLIQVEAPLSGTAVSRTAARAWQWVPIRAGSEGALAAGLARVLLDEHLVRARGPMPTMTAGEAADQTGLSGGAILDLARTMVARPPVVAIANDGNPAIAALNVVLGAVGTRGGIVRRSKLAESYASADAVIGASYGTARAVLIDSTVPWDFVPQTDAEVFRFAAWDGGAGQADWLLPAPGFLEELTDVPTAPASAIETYAVAPSLVNAPAEVQSAAQFLGSIDPAAIAVEKIIHQRCDDLFRGRAGTVYGKEATAVAKIASAKEFEEQLWKGAVWVGVPPRSGDLRCELKEWPASGSSGRSGNASNANWSSAWLAPVLPPLASKLCQESNLREAPVGRKA